MSMCNDNDVPIPAVLQTQETRTFAVSSFILHVTISGHMHIQYKTYDEASKPWSQATTMQEIYSSYIERA